jgi:hypothetical protein
MKKLLSFGVTFVAAISLASCYNTRVLVGNVKPKEPVVEVNKEWNHHLICGLVPLDNATMDASEYVNGAENYIVKTNHSFLNMLVGCITGGIYTPTQTKYYLPLKDTQKSK